MLFFKLYQMFGMYNLISFECYVDLNLIFIYILINYFFRKEKKALEEEMNRRSVRDMEARQQCFKAECENRQLKKEMRRDKLQLKELEQQVIVLKSKSNQNC